MYRYKTLSLEYQNNALNTKPLNNRSYSYIIYSKKMFWKKETGKKILLLYYIYNIKSKFKCHLTAAQAVD